MITDRLATTTVTLEVSSLPFNLLETSVSHCLSTFYAYFTPLECLMTKFGHSSDSSYLHHLSWAYSNNGPGRGGCLCLRILDALALGKVHFRRIILRYHSLHMASVFDTVVAIEVDRGSY